MTMQAFIESPWDTSHPSYAKSPFNMRPAPEFATAEVIVASMYRALGFDKRSEGSVPAAGRAFDRECDRPGASSKAGSLVPVELWRTVLHGVLDSPKQPNQSSKRFLQLSPVVPDVALYSGSARLSSNSWNPGELVQRMVVLGSRGPQHARDVWASLFDATTVGESDDVWARWLQTEFQLRRKVLPPADRAIAEWVPTSLKLDVDLPDEDKRDMRFPAQQFVCDLAAIIEAKGRMTRRQWVSLLEAVIRLGTVSHVLWLCDVNNRIWNAVRSVIHGSEPPTLAEVRRNVCSGSLRYLAYGNPAVPRIRDHASTFLASRLGLNLVFWTLEGLRHPVGQLGSAGDIHDFLLSVRDRREEILAAELLGTFDELRDKQVRTLACKKGIGSNIVEFGRHALGQRQSANETLRGYDQGYILKKSGEHPSAPWVVALGPVAVLAFVHCCLRGVAGPRSVLRLCQHLAGYGLEVDLDDIGKSDLGRQLRMLGLVLDSPDAESGMLLVPPFGETRSPAESAIK